MLDHDLPGDFLKIATAETIFAGRAPAEAGLRRDGLGESTGDLRAIGVDQGGADARGETGAVTSEEVFEKRTVDDQTDTAEEIFLGIADGGEDGVVGVSVDTRGNFSQHGAVFHGFPKAD